VPELFHAGPSWVLRWARKTKTDAGEPTLDLLGMSSHVLRFGNMVTHFRIAGFGLQGRQGAPYSPATEAGLHDLGQNFGGDEWPQSRGDFQEAGDVGQILEALAGTAVRVAGCPDLALEKIFEGRYGQTDT
jgi:hypothetical protein